MISFGHDILIVPRYNRSSVSYKQLSSQQYCVKQSEIEAWSAPCDCLSCTCLGSQASREVIVWAIGGMTSDCCIRQTRQRAAAYATVSHY